jgi:energy-converting hydrogenase Eha subunit F
MENNFRAENRFRFYQYFFYMGGVPLFYSVLSNVYKVYSIFCHVCVYMTSIAMFMDIYHHLEDLDHVLDTSMLFTVLVCESYTIIYLR